MTKYRIRLPNGRVIGPFEKAQLFELKAKGHISGKEEAQIFPTGNWGPIQSFDFYAELMDDNKTVVQKEKAKEEATFVIDLTALRNQKNEKEIEEIDHGTMAPVEQLTETIRMTPGPVKTLNQLEDAKPEATLAPELESLVLDSAPEEPVANGFEIEEEEEENPNANKTIINPVAQQEIDKMRRLQKEAEEKKKAAEEAKKKAEEEAKQFALAAANEPAITDQSTQMIRLDKTGLLESASLEEEKIEIELKEIKKKRAKEEAIEKAKADEEEESDEAESKAKKKKFIIIAAILAIAYAVLFPEEEPQKPPFKHLEPQIVFPIPFDQADDNKAKVEFNRGLELFNYGSYPSLVKSGLNFKAAYENNIENITTLGFMVRSYAEQLQYSNNKLMDAQTVFNIIQTRKPFLIQDANGVIGLNMFYMAISKPDAAIDVVQKYLKLKPKDIVQDLFAVYVQSLLKQGKIDLAKQFYSALIKAPQKSRYTYDAIISFMLLDQETDKALEMVNEAIKAHPHTVSFILKKADLHFRKGDIKTSIELVKKADAMNLDYNNINRAKYLELKGLIYAYNKKVKEATAYLTQSLKINDSEDLRIKLSSLEPTEGQLADTDKLINESLAVKRLIEARDFYERHNYELALSAAAKATDAYPGHIASEIFLSKVQMKLGLAKEGIKTLEALAAKYGDDKNINLALIEAYINTYKFNDARTRIQIISSTDIRDTWEYASMNAKLQMKMGDTLQAMSWFKNSISLNPLNDSDIYALAEILLKKANFDAAKLMLNKCMELDPVNPDYRIAYARLLYETQDDQAAIGYLLSLQDEFGENPKIMSEIAIFYYRSGKVKDFQDYRAKLEKLHSSDKALYEFLIKAALLDERFEEVPVLVEKLLAVEPGELEYMMTAGRVLFEKGKLVEAAKWFKRIQDKLPSYPKVLYFIAKIDFLNNDLEGALKKIQEDIKVNGENDEDLVFMAQIHQAKAAKDEKGGAEDFIMAENLFKKAQKLNPKSYDALIGLADLSTTRNNYDLALDLYKRAMKLKQDEPLVHKKIGDLYRLIGQGALAIESYKMYLEMDPESPHKNNLEKYINDMR